MFKNVTTFLFVASVMYGGAVASAQQAVLFRNVRILDGTDRAPIENGFLLVEGTKISYVGQTAPAHLPDHTQVLDETGKTILPGLIADHAHVGMVAGATAGADNYTQENILAALNQYERYGVTTVTSLGLNGALFYSLQPKLHAGLLPGADLFGADRGIAIPGGAPPVTVGTDRLYRVTTLEQAREAVRDTATRHPSFVKIWVDNFHGTLPSEMPPEISTAVIEEAHKRGMRVAAHVYYLADAKELVKAGIDLLAHGVRDVPVDAEFIALMKQHGTWYIPTLDLDESSFMYAEHPAWMDTSFFRASLSPQLRSEFNDRAWRESVLAKTKGVEVSKAALAMNERNLKTLVNAGVHVGFGTDSGATPLRIPGFAEHRELALMVEAGLTPSQAIHIATEEAAALLGLNDRGVLTPGKLADLLVVDGNPADNITRVDGIIAVYHRGKLASGNK